MNHSGRSRSTTALLTAVLALVFCACARHGKAADMTTPALPAATAKQLPRWRGFNLLEKFYWNKDRKPFLEQDFRLIHQWGFNFVRLPMDYRCWIKDGNWEQFDEATLKEIDQAVALGGQYAVHVSLNFHRAPGYTVARPAEPQNLWTDAEAQRVCALHWATFAKRYRGVPNSRLSFNLMNEPGMVAAADYARVVKLLVEAIHREDPERLVICDGIMWGTKPVPELVPLGVAQATRGYTPMEVSHYQASWVNGERFPKPVWPRPANAHGMLYQPGKPEHKAPIAISGPFEAETTLRLHVMTVSQTTVVVVSADGKPVFEKQLVCGPGEGEWKKSEYKEQWKIYQCLYDKDYTTTIPAGTREVTIAAKSGDWLQVSELGVTPAGGTEGTIALDAAWGQPGAKLRWAEGRFQSSGVEGREWLRASMIDPWRALQAQGVGVMVGEFGAFNKTPHDVVLRWLEDSLANWKEAGWGWAMWNFRGSFGILDSGRADVKYEAVEGHQLDRRMLELLQRY